MMGDNSGSWLEAKKDKYLVYMAEPDRNMWAVDIVINKEYFTLKEFNNFSQFLKSYNKAKLSF